MDMITPAGAQQTSIPLIRLAYNLRDAALALGIKDTSLKTLVREGEIPHFYMGNRRYIRADDLRAFLDRASGREPQRLAA